MMFSGKNRVQRQGGTGFFFVCLFWGGFLHVFCILLLCNYSSIFTFVVHFNCENHLEFEQFLVVDLLISLIKTACAVLIRGHTAARVYLKTPGHRMTWTWWSCVWSVSFFFDLLVAFTYWQIKEKYFLAFLRAMNPHFGTQPDLSW